MERRKFVTRMLTTAAAVFFLSPAFTEEHTVQRGENLWSIGRMYSVSIEELCRENGIKKEATLREGQKLLIPSRYVVAPGDTLYGIAGKFGMDVEALKKLNSLQSDTIREGQSLTVRGTPPRPGSDTLAASSPLWPVKASAVTYVAGKISGVQLEARKDEEVTSISSGTVMFSGAYRGFGQVVFVQNGTGYVYVYTGLSSIAVQKGDSVNAGNVLGKTGVDSVSGKSRLTFMVYHNGKPLDPAMAPRG
ncbi:MAG: LysM peptidoglycan-binding domain-containing protein [Spirochaetaceae bacterium]|nr:LysM peptidoglycan-binding domain-containing protein [Spirochaetaceae bacterium]